MDVAYSETIALNDGQGKPRPGDNSGRVSSLSVAYDSDYAAPKTSISLNGTHGQNQAVIDRLLEQGLKGIRIEAIDPDERRSDLSVSFSNTPKDVITALRKASLISERDSWSAVTMTQRAEMTAEMRRNLINWRQDQTAANQPSRTTAPSEAPPPIRQAM